MTVNKKGFVLGLLSFIPVVLFVIIYFVVRGPNVDLPFVITIYVWLAFAGIALAVSSLFVSKSKWFVLNVVSIALNVGVVVVAALLMIAVGISEP